MKNGILLFLFAFLLVSCGSTRNTKDKVVIANNEIALSSKKASKIITHALSFEGTRYKFGGMDKRGMDCSGLVYTSFKKENISLPRISREMAKRGIRIKLHDTEEGDLLFFQTNKNSRVINHVGLVVKNKRGDIRFIHSTTSRGVIISSLEESYWKNAFVEVRRVI